MKKFIAIAMSGLLALSSVSVAAAAEPVVPSVSAVTDMTWSQNARPVSAEELAQIRSQLPEKNVMPEDPEDDIQTGYGVITGPLIEAVMSVAQEAAVDSESQVEPPVLAQITASMAILEHQEGYEYTFKCNRDIYIHGDESKMNQVIINFINIIKSIWSMNHKYFTIFF